MFIRATTSPSPAPSEPRSRPRHCSSLPKKLDLRSTAPQGAIDLSAVTACRKACPDTNLKFFRSLLGSPTPYFFPLQHDENCERDQVTPTEHAVGLQPLREEQRDQARDPDRRSKRVKQQHLLGEVLEGRQCNVAAAGLDVAHELHKRPVMLQFPNKVG